LGFVSGKIADVVRAKQSFESFALNDDFIDQSYYDQNGGVVLKDYHKDWVEKLEKHDKIALTAFTGSGKTTVPGVLYPLWKIFNNPGYEVLVVSATMSQSKKILNEIKHHISECEYLNDLKPDDRSATWNQTEIELTNDSKIYCKPFTEAVKGVHVDLVICDEAAEFDDHEMYSRYVVTRAESKDGTVCLISTPVHENDLMSKMSDGTMTPKCPSCGVSLDKAGDGEWVCSVHGSFSKEESRFDENVSSRNYWSKTYPVYREVEEGVDGGFRLSDDKWVRPVFPENFDERRIRELRDEDMTMFQKEYLCEPLAVEGDLFDPNDIIELYDKSEDFENNVNPRSDYYMGADFAVSHQGDYSVFTVVEDPRGGVPVVRNMERIRGMGLDAQEKRIKELHQIYRFKRIVLDETNFGTTVKKSLKEQGLPIRGQGFKLKQRNNLIVGLKNAVEKGELILPRGGEQARKLTDKLYEELLGFGTSETQGGSITYKSTAKHDDTVMSLAMVLTGIDDDKPVVATLAY
jgi:hypothetical protein